jgi:hypothetical protein
MRRRLNILKKKKRFVVDGVDLTALLLADG